MSKKQSIAISLFLSAFLLLAVIGCGNGDKKAEQVPTKTAATQETKKEAPKEEKTGFIVGTDVNAREKASTDSAIVGTFALGEKVVILADEPEWAKVKRSDGKECYVFKKFLGDQEALDNRNAKYAGFTVLNRGTIPPMVTRKGADTSLRVSPYFSQDGIGGLYFNAIIDNDRDPQKVSFSLKGTADLWSTRLIMTEVYAGNSVMQLKARNSEKILYTLGGGVEAYILGYDTNSKKAIVHFDSTPLNGSYQASDIDAKDFQIKDGQLYLVIRTVTSHPQKPPVAYRLFWDNKASGIGYEYIGKYSFQ